MSYTVSFMAIIDLMSIIPYYLELILESQGKGDALPSSALMAFRVVRVLRIFKLTRNNQTLVDFVNAMVCHSTHACRKSTNFVQIWL